MPTPVRTRILGMLAMSAAVTALLVAGPLTKRASAMQAKDATPSDAERESEIFGSPETPADATLPTAAEATAPTRSETPEPGQVSSDTATLVERVVNKEDILAIGGLVYLRNTYSYRRDEKLREAPLRAPSLFDPYADARPSERVRVYIRGRFRFDFSTPSAAATTAATAATPNPLGTSSTEQSSAQLDQLWIKFDIERTVFVTVGKQPLKWGTGRFWNPTDFLNPQRRDPLSAFDERLGISLIKFQMPLETEGVNLYAIADYEGSESPDEVGAAVRAEVVLGETESALSATIRKDRPLILGADFSAGIWDLDFRFEGAVLHNDKSPYFEGNLDFGNPASILTIVEVDRSKEWIPQLVGGVEYAFNYSDEDSVAIGAEYFYNDAGYDNANLYPWLLFQGAFRPLYNGKHYAGVYSFLAGPGSWNDTTFIGSVLTNLSDQSYLARFDYRAQFLTYLNLDTFVNYHFGENGEFNLGLRVPPIPVVPQLSQGLQIAQPRIDVGVGLRVAF